MFPNVPKWLEPFLADLPAMELIKLNGHVQRLAPLKAHELTHGQLTEIFGLLDKHGKFPNAVRGVLDLMKDAPADETVGRFFEKHTENGTLQKLFLHPTTRNLLSRCPHCGQPEDVQLSPDVEDSVLHRCPHCRSPYEIVL